ncbi:MAG: hypothetical protein M0R06_00210 [Sphaerochaeta sp.]|jgi:hypothetical protein|nr:hypothetical protein [Sphaerochaeta sp.]
MATTVTNIVFEPGYIVIHRDSGPATRYPVADVLRALDIPAGLDQTQIKGLTTLANIFTVVFRTLIDNGTLGENFLEDGDYDLADIVETIENLGGSYTEPDLSTE